MYILFFSRLTKQRRRRWMARRVHGEAGERAGLSAGRNRRGLGHGHALFGAPRQCFGGTSNHVCLAILHAKASARLCARGARVRCALNAVHSHGSSLRTRVGRRRSSPWLNVRAWFKLSTLSISGPAIVIHISLPMTCRSTPCLSSRLSPQLSMSA